MRKNSNELFIAIIMLIFVIACIVIDKIYFEGIINSDIPNWLKWMILR